MPATFRDTRLPDYDEQQSDASDNELLEAFVGAIPPLVTSDEEDDNNYISPSSPELSSEGGSPQSMYLESNPESFDSEDSVSITDSEDGSLILEEDAATGSDEMDPVVSAIYEALEKKKLNHPPDIVFDEMLGDICLHPLDNMIAVATLGGTITFHAYSNESTEVLKTFTHHKKSVRNIDFDDQGTTLYSVSLDTSVCVVDVQTGLIRRRILQAHESSLHKILVMDYNIFATGDDNGLVKVWDLRREAAVASFSEMTDYVIDMKTTEDKKVIACTCGAGNLTAYNLKNRRLETQSHDYDDDLTTLAIVKSDTKLVAGTGMGKMYIFNWGELGDHSDTYPGYKETINSMVAISDDVTISAMGDGTIRATSFFPHKSLGIVGRHDEVAEKVDISNDGRIIASYGHDQTVRFWNISYFEETDLSTVATASNNQKSSKESNLPSSKQRNTKDFFADMASDG